MAARAARAAITKIKKLLAAVVVSMITCFELCFTGKAVGAWRIARADGRSNIITAGENVTSAVRPPAGQSLSCGAGEYNPSFPPDPAPNFLLRLVIVIAIAVLIIAGVLLSVESTGSPHTEDGIQGIEENQMASGMGMDPQSSAVSRADKIKIAGCAVLSILIIGGIALTACQAEIKH